MGKIISIPKAPKAPAPPPPVVVKAPEPEPTPVAAPEPTAEELADAERVKAIASRRRGRLGTVGTSLRGVLSDTIGDAAGRKTLLGE